MPNPVRLPAEVPDGEIRVYWDNTPDNGDDLHVWAGRGMQRFALGIFSQKPLKFNGDFSESFALRSTGKLVEGPSVLDELIAHGYDPQTLVFSIRKPGTPVDVPVDGALNALQDALAAVEKIVRDRAEEVKSVVVYDEGDHQDLVEKLNEARRALDVFRLNAPGA